MTSSIEDALKNARYNEAVIVTIPHEANSDENKEIVLVATLDKVSGGVSWQDAAALSSNVCIHNIDVGIQRHLRTKNWIKPMLNDDHRNSLYSSSIRKACAAAIQNLAKDKEGSEERKTSQIIDIGSGTGLLAMLAARSMQKIDENLVVKVTSIEMASAMGRLARKIIKSNDLDGRIDVIEGHSCSNDFNPYPCDNKAILCTSELLETGLLGEGIIPAMRDAWNRHLNADAIVVPQKARVYVQVVESTFCQNYVGPKIDAKVRLSTSGLGNDAALLGNNGGLRVPLHAESLFENADSPYYKSPTHSPETAECATILSKSMSVLEFDFTSKESIPPPCGRSSESKLIALKSGIAHGVLFWWELDLWEGETYSTEVGKSPWQDHWQQCLYVFSDDCEQLSEGQPFTLVSSHDDTSISFKILPNKLTDEQAAKKRRLEEKNEIIQPRQNHITHDRALQLNDKDRMAVLHNAIERAIKYKGKDSIILDISDFCLCSAIAARAFGAERVTSLESSTNGIPLLSARVAQIGNQLPREGCEFQVINAYAENLTIEHLGGKIDIIMAEPYYEILESWHLQEALNYYYLLRALKQRDLVKSDAISIPSTGSIMACAVQLDETVARSHSDSQLSSLCGFAHEKIFEYGNPLSAYDMKIPAFQYKWKRLSPNFEIAKLQYDGIATQMKIHGDGEWSQSELSVGDYCHGIFIWVEYDYWFGESNERKLIISTGNRHHHQAFRFLKSPAIVKDGDRICVKPMFNTHTFEDHDFEITIKGQ